MQIIIKHIIGILLLLLAEQSFAQNEYADVQAKMERYTQTRVPEKIFLHTDKEFYTAGEIIWFKMYVVDGMFHKPLAASHVAYVELLDKNNKPAWRDKISLDKKGGNGSFQLPFSFHSGYYTLRAYTNWMKNKGAEHFFEKTLTVVNTLKSFEAENEITTPSYVLNLFPEGGNLVDGLSSKIAFHVTDRFGKGVPGKGYLLNSKYDTLSSFVTYKFGMGHFDINPQKIDTYKVIFEVSDGSLISQVLPTIFERGYTIKVEEVPDDKVKIIVHSNSNLANGEVYLLTQTRQIVKDVQKKIIENGTVSFLVDKKILGEGVSQFTLFNRDKKPVCERLFFKQPTTKTTAGLLSRQDKYTTRDKVDLVVDVPDDVQNNMSLSVYLLDELQNTPLVDIHNYLWLTSELNGTIEQPSYYFSTISGEVKQATDYLMLTHGWRRFKWDSVPHHASVPKFSLESSGHIISGTITDLLTNTTAKDVQVFVSFPGTPYMLYTAISDSNGVFQFEVKNYFGRGEMVVQTYPLANTNYRIDLFSPFAETYTTTSLYPLTLSPSLQVSLVNNSIAMQAHHIYRADSIHRFLNPAPSDSFPFYGRPFNSYDLDKYVRFNTMEEVLREYVIEINVGVKGSGASLRFKLFNLVKGEFYNDEILVMVDGIPLSDPNQVFSLDPLKIKKIDVIPQNYILGAAKFYGLVNFLTYNGHYEDLELDPKAVRIDYEGLQLQREFYLPDYSSEQQRSARIPDLRTTLFWMPDLNSKQVSFYTGDNKGKYLVTLQGIDANGKTISSSLQIEVE